MLRIAIVNDDYFYSKLLAAKLMERFQDEIVSVAISGSNELDSENEYGILSTDLIILGDIDFNQRNCLLYQVSKHPNKPAVITNSNYDSRNESLLLNDKVKCAIPKEAFFDCYSNPLKEFNEWDTIICGLSSHRSLQ